MQNRWTWFVYCSTLSCVAVCCREPIDVFLVCCSALPCATVCHMELMNALSMCCSVLQSIVVCCRELIPAVSVCCCALQCVAVCCSVLQCVVVDTFSHTQLLVFSHFRRRIQKFHVPFLTTHCNTLQHNEPL